MKYFALTILLFLFCTYDSTAQISSFQTGLGIEIEGNYSLLMSDHHESSLSVSISPGLFRKTMPDADNFSTMNNSERIEPSIRYTQSSLYTHSHRRNAEAFTDWKPEMSFDRRHENRTQIFIDGARGLFQVFRGSQ